MFQSLGNPLFGYFIAHSSEEEGCSALSQSLDTFVILFPSSLHLLGVLTTPTKFLRRQRRQIPDGCKPCLTDGTTLIPMLILQLHHNVLARSSTLPDAHGCISSTYMLKSTAIHLLISKTLSYRLLQ